MSYVQDLRAIVGHRPLILAAAGLLVVNAQGYVLLQRRTDDGLWGVPGGSMELGESTEATARRELYEETGLIAGEMALFDVFSGDEMRHIFPNGDEAEIVSVIYTTRDVRGELRACSDESLALRFFSPEELVSVALSQPNKPIIRRLLQAQGEQGNI